MGARNTRPQSKLWEDAYEPEAKRMARRLTDDKLLAIGFNNTKLTTRFEFYDISNEVSEHRFYIQTLLALANMDNCTNSQYKHRLYNLGLMVDVLMNAGISVQIPALTPPRELQPVAHDARSDAQTPSQPAASGPPD